MAVGIEGTLEKNLAEFFELAEYAFETGRHNAAVTLYYKALVEICQVLPIKMGGLQLDRGSA
jgi:hypothetical protein